MRWPRGLAALAERNYALYIFGHFLSQTGAWLDQTSISWLLYTLTDSTVVLGLGGMARAAPIIILSLLGGALADRLPKRSLLVATESLQALLTLVIAALAFGGALAPWHLIAFNLVSGTLSAFSVPARQAMYPTLVPRTKLSSAVIVNAAPVRAATIIGPSIAGLALAAGGDGAPFVLSGIMSVGMVIALLALRLPPIPVDADAADRPGLRRGMVEGLAYVWREPLLLVVLGLEVLVNTFGHNAALITIIARDVLRTGPEGLGFLLSAQGVGLLGAMAFTILLHPSRPGRVIIGAGLAYGLLMVAFGLSQWLLLSGLLLAGIGMADGVWSLMRNSTAQLLVPDHLRGRVMAMVVLVTRGFTPLGHAQSGGMAALVGGPATAVLGGALIGGAVLLSALRSPELRAYRAPR